MNGLHPSAEGVDALASLLPRVRGRVAAAARAAGFPELARAAATHLGGGPLPLPLVLPIAACAAAGGDPARAVDTSAACAFILLAARWLDDAFDLDRPGDLWSEVGPARAANLGVAALAAAVRVAAESRETPRAVVAWLAEATVRMSAGQDRDLAGADAGFAACWETAALKTGASYALLARAGALAAEASRAEAGACEAYGTHLGTLVQALDDVDGAFRPVGAGDLAAGKVTLPVAFALDADHPARDELRALARAGALAASRARVREILHAVDARGFLVWAALREREHALAALQPLPVDGGARRAGRRALEALADAPFVDLDDLLSSTRPA